jgi:hypothetical protein
MYRYFAANETSLGNDSCFGLIAFASVFAKNQFNLEHFLKKMEMKKDFASSYLNPEFDALYESSK